MRKASLAAICALMAAGILTLPADAAKRRQIKSATSKNQPAQVSTVPTDDGTETSVSEATTKTSNLSRGARRRNNLPQETEQANSSVRNQSASTSRTPTSNTSKSMSTTATSKSNVKSNSVQDNNKSPLQKIQVVKPDLNKIKAETLNPKSNFYYPKLWEKYNDKLKMAKMTPEEYRYLYLGYMFQEDYDPYRVSVYAEAVDSMRDREDFTPAERNDLISKLNLSLKDNPFDLRQMSFLVHLLKASDKNYEADKWERRLENFLAAIKSTGTGENKDKAWYVIYPMHEYDMVQLLGYRAVDIDYNTVGYDHLLVEPDGSVKINKPVKGFYFNVEVPQQQYVIKHPEVDGEGADE